MLSASEKDVVKKRCWFSHINVFDQFLPHMVEVLLPSFFCHLCIQTNTERSPIQVPMELFQIVFLTKIQLVGDHTDFVQEEQLVLRCLTKIWHTLYRGRRIENLEISTMLKHPAFLHGFHKLILHRLLELAKCHSQCHIGVQFVLCFCGISIPTPVFFELADVQKRCKMNCPLSFLCLFDDLLFAPDFGHAQCWKFSSCSHSLSTAALASWTFVA